MVSFAILGIGLVAIAGGTIISGMFISSHPTIKRKEGKQMTAFLICSGIVAVGLMIVPVFQI